MTRVGTCQDCDAKYKIPDSVTATKAKCKKCGGTVVIPALGGAPAASKPAAPKAKKAAPAKSAPSKAPRKAASKAAAAAPAASGARKKAGGGSRRAGGAKAGGKRGGSKRSGGKSEKKGSPMPMVLGILGLIVVAGAVWWFGLRDDGSSTTPATDTTEQTTTDDTAAPDETATDPTTDDAAPAAEAAAPAAEPVAAAPAPAPAPAASTDDGAPAAAATAAPAAKDEGPYDPILAFDRIAPVPGTTDDDLATWEQELYDTFLDPPHPKVQKTKIAALNEIDIVDLTPAIMNSLIGLDTSDPIQLRDSTKLIQWWQERTRGTPTFTWVGDATRTGQEDVDLRVKTINDLLRYWASKKNDPELLDALRKKIADRIAKDG